MLSRLANFLVFSAILFGLVCGIWLMLIPTKDANNLAPFVMGFVTIVIAFTVGIKYVISGK